MTERIKPVDPQSVFCEVCLKLVPKSESVTAEARDHVAYFCGAGCHGRWRGERAPQPAPLDIQEGRGRSPSRDDRVKRTLKQHPQRDEPRVDSIEPDETP